MKERLIKLIFSGNLNRKVTMETIRLTNALGDPGNSMHIG